MVKTSLSNAGGCGFDPWSVSTKTLKMVHIKYILKKRKRYYKTYLSFSSKEGGTSSLSIADSISSPLAQVEKQAPGRRSPGRGEPGKKECGTRSKPTSLAADRGQMQQQAGGVSRWVREEQAALRLPPDEAGGQRKGAAGVQEEEEGPPTPREATEKGKHGANKE